MSLGAIEAAPQNKVEFESGYELDDNDYHDAKTLCQRFGFELPSEYAEFEK